ncbi:hypothetical protein ACIGO9_28805 [Nocardia asteroides]|uniref:hypothetical protein n=1 Tax=Nocardia asteroides TaxID=1824 RepID=UPI0037CBAFB7
MANGKRIRTRRNRVGYDFDWYEVGRTPYRAPINPAVQEVLKSPRWGMKLMSIAGEARDLWRARARKGKTRQLSERGRVDLAVLGTRGSEPGRWAGELVATANHAAYIEFGGENSAADRTIGKRQERRFARGERVRPGEFARRYLGDHTLGGDNRRVNSIVSDIERRYGNGKR